MLEHDGRSLSWNDELAPGHTRHNGELFIGGVSASDLASKYGTPSLIIDGSVLDETIGRLQKAAAKHDIDVAYAGKALLLVGLVRLLIQTKLNLDVCSLGELATAERAGMPASRMSLHGCGKTAEELAAAATGRVGRTIVDSLDELEALARTARPQAPAPVLLRINTGIEAHTHAFVQTAGGETKFGIAPRDFPAAADLLKKSRSLRFLGLHSHIGSQIYESAAFKANVLKLMDTASEFCTLGLEVAEIVVGGGFGVETGPGHLFHVDIAQVMDEIAAVAKDRAAARNILRPKIGLEPGRAIIARAGTSLYRVMAKKKQAAQTFIVVDGGIADNPRPALYDAYHHAVLASRTSNAPLEQIVVCGRSCENDRLTECALPGDIAEGDLVAVCTTGAYTYSMASNYNRFAKPAVIFASGSEHRLLARRETLDDILRNDVDA